MTLNVLLSANTQIANAGGNAVRLMTELSSVAGTNPKQAIRMAGLFAKRELDPERKQILVDRLARIRANAHRNAGNQP